MDCIITNFYALGKQKNSQTTELEERLSGEIRINQNKPPKAGNKKAL